MAIIESGTASGQQFVDTNKAARTTIVPRTTNVGGVGGSYKLAAITGTIGAALGSASTVFAMRLDPSAPAGMVAYLEKIKLQFTTIVAFTTPVTVARRLELYRGSGAAPSGGTSINPTDDSNQNDSNFPPSEFFSTQGGATQIATTGALTVTSITFDTQPLGVMPLTHVGAAGGNAEKIWEWDSTHEKPYVIAPGYMIAVRNPAAMDAAGTWQLAVEVEWSELVP